MRRTLALTVLVVACACASDRGSDYGSPATAESFGTAEPMFTEGMFSESSYGPPDHFEEPTGDAVGTRMHALSGGLVVPPDRALLVVTVTVAEDGERGRVHQALVERVKAIRAGAAKGGCLASLVDTRPIVRVYEGSYEGQAELLVEVDLKGVDGVEARQARLEACMSALDPLVDAEGLAHEGLGPGAPRARHGAWSLVVDAPKAHFEALLAREAQSYATMNGALPPQLRADRFRCVPSGEVVVAASSLAGVALVLEQTCEARPFPSDEEDAPMGIPE